MPQSKIFSAVQKYLVPLGKAYAFALRLRRQASEKGLKKQTKMPIPCISVGNIAWGGTGKTPLVAWLMDWAKAKGLSPTILTRGYKGQATNPPVLVSDKHTAKEVGDEALMLYLMARAKEQCRTKNKEEANTQEPNFTLNSLPKTHVIVDPKRVRAAHYALKELASDLFILDDAMQHIAIGRDLELVVLRPKDLNEEWNRVIPAGSWREDKEALRLADAFFIKLEPQHIQDCEAQLVKRLQGLSKPVFTFSLAPKGLQSFQEAFRQNCEEGGASFCHSFTKNPYESKEDYAFVCGIGQPKQAQKSLTDFIGRPPASSHFFPDHHAFTARDLALFKSLNTPIVCTYKDAARLAHLDIDFPLYIFHVELVFGKSFFTHQSFPSWLDAWWDTHNFSKK